MQRTKLLPLALIAAAASALSVPAASGKTLAQAIEAELAKVRKIKSRKVTFGIEITQADSSKVLYRANSSAALIPASNMKLITTAAAMTILGPKFQFKTRIGALGDDLVVIGSGDPSIGDPVLAEGEPVTAVFDRWARKLRDRGIDNISGSLILDASIFEKQYRHPNWPANQFHRWYAAPVGAFNFNDNCVDLTAEVDDEGLARIGLSPNCKFIQIQEQLLPLSNNRTSINAYWAEDWRLAVKVVFGKQAKARATLPVDDPTAFFAEALRERLAHGGLKVHGPTRYTRVLSPDGKPPDGLKILLEHRSGNLAALLGRANKTSQNLFAECIFKRLGYEHLKRTGRSGSGSWLTGKEAVRKFLREKLKLADGNFIIDDGGGLSRRNRLSARAIAAVLHYALGQDWWHEFMSGLAVAAKDGTLRRRMSGTAAAKRIYAKTGYVASASALSGYVVDETGRVRIVFAMLFNNFPRGQLWRIKLAQDRICIVLAKHTR